MARYEECDDPERLAAHRTEHGPGSVERFYRHGGGSWGASGLRVPAQFSRMMRDFRYRLVLPDPAPSSRPEGLPEDAVEVPWFEHPAWVVRGDTLPIAGWERLWAKDPGPWEFGPWEVGGWTGAVVVRQTPTPAPPATVEITPTPAALHELIGRTCAEDEWSEIERVEQDRYGWSVVMEDGSEFAGTWDGTVTVLREDGAS